MNCHKCNQKTEWITQSVNLSYWYCRDCKVEPLIKPRVRHQWAMNTQVCAFCNITGVQYAMYEADCATWIDFINGSVDFDDLNRENDRD